MSTTEPPTGSENAALTNGRVVAWFSHGACSAVACRMALAKFGPGIVIANIDTGSEHEDNPRFRADCEEWFGHEIIVLKSEKYADVDDVIERTRYINGQAGARCTAELKKAVRHAWERPDDLHVWGYANSQREKDRADRFVVQNPGVDSWFPLIERDLSKSVCLAMVERAGIDLPAMYLLGYVNNNCIGCVKGGKGYWNKIREDFPAVFARRAAQEQDINHSCINGTFLDDLVPGTGRYKPEPIECDLNCQPVEDEWVPVTLGGAREAVPVSLSASPTTGRVGRG